MCWRFAWVGLTLLARLICHSMGKRKHARHWRQLVRARLVLALRMVQRAPSGRPQEVAWRTAQLQAASKAPNLIRLRMAPARAAGRRRSWSDRTFTSSFLFWTSAPARIG